MKLEYLANLKKNCGFRILGNPSQSPLHYLALVAIQVARRHTKAHYKPSKHLWTELHLESLNWALASVTEQPELCDKQNSLNRFWCRLPRKLGQHTINVVNIMIQKYNRNTHVDVDFTDNYGYIISNLKVISHKY